MENDLRLKIADYFNMSYVQRDLLIRELTDFYFEKNVSTRNPNEFEVSISQLLYWLELEHKFALKTEDYNRVEIYQKLCRIFNSIREKYYQALEEEDNGL